MNKPVSPNVRCVHGHKDQPGYVICKHIIEQGERPAAILLATPEKLGQVVCELGGQAHTVEDLVMVCVECAKGHGWLRV